MPASAENVFKPVLIIEQAVTIVRTAHLPYNPFQFLQRADLKLARKNDKLPVHDLNRNRTFPRREFLITASAVVWASGCRTKKAAEVTPAPRRRDVPLRIVLVGNDQDAEILTRGWASVISQPLNIETLEFSRAAAGNLSKLPELAKNSDLLIYPLLAVPDLFAAEALVPLTPEEFEAGEEELGRVCAAAKNGAATYAGELVALPLGARLPALITADDVDPLATWADYDRWVGQLEGAAGEPLAAGWAGAMFLWRAVSTLETSWLFAREGLTPLVDAEPYIEVLTQMKTTAERYQSSRQRPAEIWSRIEAGEIRGGICFPVGSGDDLQVNVSDLPGALGANRVLLDPFSPVISISSACRQTAASKEFARWLSGGDGSDSIRRQIPGMTQTRKHPADVRPSDQDAGGYGQWLQRRLEVPITFPSMQLPSGGEYYDDLDQQVGRCIDGEVSPADALAEVAARWKELNRMLGIEKQERAWRRAQGMRA